MSLKKLILLLILTLSLAFLYENKNKINALYLKYFNQISEVEEVVKGNLPKRAERQVSTPPPLEATEEEQSPQSFLTVEGVIRFTNMHRNNEGLPPLEENELLNQAALVKAQDMFEKQYFAHESPDGVNVDDLAENEGYEFIAIGENLALGNFLNDEVLVQGWMDSPGHRENILKERYTQIGVAVVQGTYNGQQTWMAVQHFGLPLSSCPQIDDSLKNEIDENEEELEERQEDLNERKEELEEMRKNGDSEYNEKAEEYNELAEEYNELLTETKSTIERYNAQVREFNECAG